MAAPSIPNLSTLRSRGGGGGGLRGLRGRGRGPEAEESTEEDKALAHDRIIQQTDGDASSSRMSAVALGYLADLFALPFITGQIAKRYPIINRGTYVRTTAIDRLVATFLSTNPSEKKQILSLGAGSDTRFFRLLKPTDTHITYHELDFATNTTSKISTIQRTPSLLSLLHAPTISDDNTSLTSRNYHIHALDLRSLTTTPVPAIPNLDPETPTLIISECCLCYLPPDTTSRILHTILTATLAPSTPAALILYEPIRPYDAFGRTMVSNLSSRGIHLQTLKKYYSLDAQRMRLRMAGLGDGQGARDVGEIYYGKGGEEWITRTERERVERLEWLDEVEEWVLLARHYCVAWGWRGEVFGTAWEGVRGEKTEAERGDDEVG